MIPSRWFLGSRYIKSAGAISAFLAISPVLKSLRRPLHLNSNCSSLTRQAEQNFSFKTDCFFCGTKVEFGGQRKGSREAFRVTTIETKDTILQMFSKRGDAWAETIRAMLVSVNDLPPADAVYHKTCNVNFRTEADTQSL